MRRDSRTLISPHSVDNLTVIGSAALVAPATAGSTNSARTISAHLLTYGEQPSSVVTLERRYGPRRLRDDDDGLHSTLTPLSLHSDSTSTPLSLQNFFERSCGVVLHSTLTPLHSHSHSTSALLPLYSHSTLIPYFFERSCGATHVHSTTEVKILSRVRFCDTTCLGPTKNRQVTIQKFSSKM